MENWKEIKGYNKPYYVSNKGVFKNNFGRILTQRLDKDGYLRVRLVRSNIPKRHTVFTHRMVAKAFIPTNNVNLTINHKDGNKLNNCVENLEWCTFAENNNHAYKMGLKDNKGEKHGKSIHTNDKILSIRKLYSTGKYTQIELGKIFNMKQARISEIIKRKSWKHI